MGKYKTGLVTEHKKSMEFLKKQDRIKKIHNIGNKDVIVVEKRSVTSNLTRIAGLTAKLLFIIISLSVLAFIILLCLSSPASWTDIALVLKEIGNTIKSFFVI